MSDQRAIHRKRDGFDPAALTFSTRPDARTRRRMPRALGVTWALVAIAALLVFFAIVRAMAERTASTAGDSTPIPAEQVRINALPTDDDAAIETTWQADPYRVHKCIGADGVPSYQSAPCAGQSASAIYEATPDSAADVARARGLEQKRVRQGLVLARIAGTDGRGNAYAGSRGSDARDRQRANCEAAKARRKRTLEMVGLSRTYDLLHQLDRQVYEACKGLQP